MYQYSNWIKIQVITRKTEDSILNFFRKIFESSENTPHRILVDSGKEFDNTGLRYLCAQENIQLEFASPEHHQTTGAVERAVRTFRNLMKNILIQARYIT